MLKLEALSVKNIKELENLLSQYQEFYKTTPNTDNNLRFLSEFVSGEKGQFFLARDNNTPVGFIGMYFSYSSVRARPILILNDLFVNVDMRRQGIGKFLIQSALDYAKARGFQQVRWFTQTSNIDAQKLYAHFSVTSTEWVHYDVVC